MKWISIDDRLPEVGELVCVAYKNRKYWTYNFSRMNKDNQFKITKNKKPVEYWMKPDTPQEEK